MIFSNLLVTFTKLSLSLSLSLKNTSAIIHCSSSSSHLQQWLNLHQFSINLLSALFWTSNLIKIWSSNSTPFSMIRICYMWSNVSNIRHWWLLSHRWNVFWCPWSLMSTPLPFMIKPRSAYSSKLSLKNPQFQKLGFLPCYAFLLLNHWSTQTPSPTLNCTRCSTIWGNKKILTTITNFKKSFLPPQWNGLLTLISKGLSERVVGSDV